MATTCTPDGARLVMLNFAHIVPMVCATPVPYGTGESFSMSSKYVRIAVTIRAKFNNKQRAPSFAHVLATIYESKMPSLRVRNGPTLHVLTVAL